MSGDGESTRADALAALTFSAEAERRRKIEYCEAQIASGRRSSDDVEMLRGTLKRFNHRSTVEARVRPEPVEAEEAEGDS